MTNRLIKRLLLAVGALVLLFAVVSVLLVTAPGSRWLVEQVDSRIDGVAVEYDQGSLLSALVVRRLQFQQPGLSVQAATLTVAPDWSCLLDFSVCLRLLQLDQLSVTLSESAAADAPASDAPTGAFVMPVPFDVHAFVVTDIDVQLSDATRISVPRVSTQLALHQSLEIRAARVDTVTIDSSGQRPAAPLTIQSIANWQYTPPVLAPLSVPLPVQISDARWHGVVTLQGQQHSPLIGAGHTSLELSERGLALSSFDQTLPTGHLGLSGSVGRDWQQQLALVLEHANKSEQVSLSAQIEGDLTQWHLNWSASGDLIGDGALQVNWLAQELPLSLNGTLSAVPSMWLPDDVKPVRAQLTLSGRWNDYQMQLSSQGHYGDLTEPLNLDVALSGGLQGASLERFDIQTPAGILTASGKVTVDNEVTVAMSGQASGVDTAVWYPTIDARVNGQWQLKGIWSDDTWQLTWPQLDLDGEWFERKLSATAAGSMSAEQGLDLPNAQIILGENVATGRVTMPTWQFIDTAWKVNAPDLSQLHPKWHGALTAEAQGRGNLTSLQWQVQGNAQDLDLAGLALQRGSVDAEGVGLTLPQGTAQLHLESLSMSQLQAQMIDIRLQGSLQEHALDLSLITDDVVLDWRVTGATDLTDSIWQGTLSKADAAAADTRFSLLNTDTAITLDWSKPYFMLAPVCWQSDHASWCIDDVRYLDQNLHWAVRIEQVPVAPWLQQLAPNMREIRTDALLSLTSQGQWQVGQEGRFDGDIRLTPSTWQWHERPGQLQLSQASLTVKGHGESMTSTVRLEGPQLGTIDGQGTYQFSSQALDGRLAIQRIDLSQLKPLLPQVHELDGSIDGHLALSGTPALPDVTGEFHVRQGQLVADGLPARFGDIEQHIQLRGREAFVDGGFNVGEGHGTMRGSARWGESPKLTMAVNGKDMTFELPNGLRTTLSPDLDVEWQSGLLRVEGQLDVPHARWHIRELPPSAVSPSEDVVLVNQSHQDVTKNALLLDVQLRIDPTQSGDVKLDAFGLTADLSGQLHLEQPADKHLSAHGELRLLDGRYKAYGQDLLIRQGDILFHGPLDAPSLDVMAVRDPIKTADGVTAGLRIQGAAETPTIEVFSDPAMNQPEALSYLLRGQGLSNSTETSADAMLANALIGFGLSQSENSVQKLGRQVGIDDLTLDTRGHGDATQLALTGYIAPGVQIRYGVGVFDSASEVALRYQLMPKLYLEAVSGLNKALDLYYQLDIRPAPTKPEP
ncbi:translocation/assembly module TamB domain-containing protein [Aestuariibacter halophilus]|uniref:Translocation/assembly module TamB domain-containing protein n=1 Tax=Fluctibacter halophilus TaxID=226011 RepID=A0ABS8GAI5_9ALTE|nr:translocation/assembly module TamB domain-containing protein [Aestuariibacter halophilus]MCC2617594.1 translocation/assembly module TamB domain-containing protein [Aestuariibacter halophilus]